MKRILFAAAAILAAAALVFALNYESVEEHYSSGCSDAQTGTVTLLVSCEEIANDSGVGQVLKANDLVPDDGLIIPETEVAISDGDTAFDVLSNALNERRIHFDYSAISDRSVYVKGINNIYEYDCGDLSGWMYSVNGDFPTVSSSEYTLHDGDSLRWLYTCDLGRDVGDNYYAAQGEKHE